MNNLNLMTFLYSDYVDSPSCVYKICSNKLLIIMEKLSDTQTNETRSAIINATRARYCADKLKIKLIINIEKPTQTIRTITRSEFFNNYDDNKEISACDSNKEISACDSNKEIYTIGDIINDCDIRPHVEYCPPQIRSACLRLDYYKNMQTAMYNKHSLTDNYTGTWIKWYNNGQVESTGAYDNGEETGEWLFWHSNGDKKAVGSFCKGEKTGNWTYWHTQRKMCDNYDYMEATGNYINGLENGHWISWHYLGTKEFEGNYIDGKETGQWMTWHMNGNNESSGAYVNGNKIGYWLTWYRNKQLESVGEYIDGQKNGIWYLWDKNGMKKPDKHYVDGKETIIKFIKPNESNESNEFNEFNEADYEDSNCAGGNSGNLKIYRHRKDKTKCVKIFKNNAADTAADAAIDEYKLDSRWSELATKNLAPKIYNCGKYDGNKYKLDTGDEKNTYYVIMEWMIGNRYHRLKTDIGHNMAVRKLIETTIAEEIIVDSVNLRDIFITDDGLAKWTNLNIWKPKIDWIDCKIQLDALLESKELSVS